jgi:hypothetical protein
MIGQFTDVDNFGAPLVGQREYGYVTMQSSCNTSTQVLLEVRSPRCADGRSSAAQKRRLCFGNAVRLCVLELRPSAEGAPWQAEHGMDALHSGSPCFITCMHERPVRRSSSVPLLVT